MTTLADGKKPVSRTSGAIGFQAIANELKEKSAASAGATSKLIATLQSATSLDDVIAAQTLFIKQSAEDYATLSRLVGTLLMSVPDSLLPQRLKNAQSSNEPAATFLASRFESLINEAEEGSTDRLTGLSQAERRNLLFGTGH